MTVIWVEVTPQGIIIGGDKHRTRWLGGAIAGYSVVTKVFKTPNRKIIVGAAGLGQFGGKDKSKWLKEKIIPLQHQPIEKIAQSVHADIVTTYDAEFRNAGQPRAFIVDIAGYRKDGELWVPAVYYISNCWSIENGNLSDVRHDFGQCPEIITIERFQGLDAATINQRIVEKADAGDPVWIYHTPLVGQFRPEAEQRLNDWLSQHGTPTMLAMWERQVKQTIVAWSAYVKAQLNNETVGGGVDIVSVAPPQKLGLVELLSRIFQSMMIRWFS